MGTFRILAASVSIALAATSSCFAGAAVIETTAPLADQSNEGVKTAVLVAVQNAAKGATAMGLPHFELKGVRVLPNLVIVQVWATDNTPPRDDDDPGLQGDARRAPSPDGNSDGSGAPDQGPAKDDERL